MCMYKYACMWCVDGIHLRTSRTWRSSAVDETGPEKRKWLASMVSANICLKWQLCLMKPLRTFQPAYENNAAVDTMSRLHEGLHLTKTQLCAVFAWHGLVKIDPAFGEKCDPNFHEALLHFQQPITEGVSALLARSGTYKLHERTLRPALVGVFGTSNWQRVRWCTVDRNISYIPVCLLLVFCKLNNWSARSFFF